MSKRIITLLLAAVMLACCASLTACRKKEEVKTPTEAAQRYDSLQDIKEELDFDIKVPKGIDVEAYQIYKKNTLQVVFDGGYIRKKLASKYIGGKIEGAEVKKETIGDKEIRFYYKDDKVYLASWIEGQYAYCIGFHLGVEKDAALQYIAEIE
ncbi:MAG: hypothetical protein IJR60_00540 [Eubacterium sp.]|nr:hypothetical protein [Eubacterium sp.]